MCAWVTAMSWPFLLGVQGGSHISPKTSTSTVLPLFIPARILRIGSLPEFTLGSEFYHHQCPEWEYGSHPWEVLFVPLLLTSSLPTLR